MKTKNKLAQMLMDRIFPKTADFFGMFNDQLELVATTAERLVEYMETGSKEIGNKIREDENTGDVLKAAHLKILSDSFTTPIDREDIYRSIMVVDEMLKYFKATVSEMETLGVEPNKHSLDMAMHLRDGVFALRRGYGKIGTTPQKAIEDCNAASKEESRVEKIYRMALAELFQGDDYLNMFKRREIYRHLSNAADRLKNSADTLQNILVKII